jgi:hypothetical protein
VERQVVERIEPGGKAQGGHSLVDGVGGDLDLRLGCIVALPEIWCFISSSRGCRIESSTPNVSQPGCVARCIEVGSAARRSRHFANTIQILMHVCGNPVELRSGQKDRSFSG